MITLEHAWAVYRETHDSHLTTPPVLFAECYRIMTPDFERLAELLRETGHVLWQHHDVDVHKLALGSTCPICSNNGTETYPDNLFGRIERALGGRETEPEVRDREVPVCATCGSRDITGNANARWDVESQAWKCAEPFDEVFCETCDAASAVKWKYADDA